MFNEEDFEKVVEFSENEEEEATENDNFLQFCEEIREVSDESLQ